MPSYPFSLQRQRLLAFPIWLHSQANDMHRNTALNYMVDQYILNQQQFYPLNHSNLYCNTYSFYYSLYSLPVTIILNAYQILHLDGTHRNVRKSSLFYPSHREVKLSIMPFPSRLFLCLHI